MISNPTQNSKANKYKEQRLALQRQREEAIKNALATLKNNLKFYRLVVYSLNTLEGFVTPPNKDIRENSKEITASKTIYLIIF